MIMLSENDNDDEDNYRAITPNTNQHFQQNVLQNNNIEPIGSTNARTTTFNNTTNFDNIDPFSATNVFSNKKTKRQRVSKNNDDHPQQENYRKKNKNLNNRQQREDEEESEKNNKRPNINSNNDNNNIIYSLFQQGNNSLENIEKLSCEKFNELIIKIDKINEFWNIDMTNPALYITFAFKNIIKIINTVVKNCEKNVDRDNIYLLHEDDDNEEEEGEENNHQQHKEFDNFNDKNNNEDDDDTEIYNFNIENIKDAESYCIQEIFDLHSELYRPVEVEQNIDTYNQLIVHLHNIYTRIEKAFLFAKLYYDQAVKQNKNPQSIDRKCLSNIIFMSIIDNGNLMDEKMRIRFILLQRLKQEKYKKGPNKDYVYKQIYTKKNYATHYWVEYIELAQWLNNNTAKENNYNLHHYIHSNNQEFNSILNYLKTVDNLEYEQLVENKYFYAFENGIYNCKDNIFIRYNSKQYNNLAESFTVYKYFESIFDDKGYDNNGNLMPEFKDYYKTIKVENFETILNTQRLDNDVKDIIYSSIGRLKYDVGYDKLQYALFFKGVAGSGKSNLSKYVQTMFPKSKIGLLSSSSEEIFGLQNLIRSDIVMCMETKATFSTPVEQIQSMISGDSLNIPVKFNNPTTIPAWKSHLFFVGNEFFGWRDDNGAISRRFLIIDFPVKPQKIRNMNDDESIIREIPNFIRKCNEYYLNFLEKINNNESSDIWSYVPNYFKNTKLIQSSVKNNLFDFLTNSKWLYKHPDAPEGINNEKSTTYSILSLELIGYAYVCWGKQTGRIKHSTVPKPNVLENTLVTTTIESETIMGEDFVDFDGNIRNGYYIKNYCLTENAKNSVEILIESFNNNNNNNNLNNKRR